MPYRSALAVLAMLCAFAAGFASSHLFERSAQAQSAPLASTVYVPADGLAFRTFDGRVIARLWYDRRGGAFDVYDSEERASTGMRPDVVSVQSASPRGPVRGGRIDLGF